MRKIIALLIVTLLFFAWTNLIVFAQQEPPYKVTIDSFPKQISLSKLSTFDYGTPSYYFTIKVSVTNQDSKPKTFMTDDDCSFASWKTDKKNISILRGSCIKNVYETVTLNPGQSYSTTLKIAFPKSYTKHKISFRIGFIEILKNYERSQPYWSKEVSISIVP